MSKVTCLISDGSRRQTQDFHASTHFLSPEAAGSGVPGNKQHSGGVLRKRFPRRLQNTSGGSKPPSTMQDGNLVLKKSVGLLKGRELGYI